MKVSIVIPAYNEELRLGPFLDTIIGYMATRPNDISEVVIVDDGSTDNTISKVKAHLTIFPQLRLLEHSHNRGKGAAVQTGVLAAQFDLIVFMDADGATPITELPKMIAALQDSDIAVGNRWLPGAKTERHSPLRQLSGWVYRTYMKLFGLGAIDTMCGFKGYHKRVAHDLFSNLLEERWLFDTEVAYKSVRRGYTTKNFPIEWTSQDGSKLDTKTLIRSALSIWPLIQRIKVKEATGSN